MASIRKLERDEMVAYAKHVEASADAIVLSTNLAAIGRTSDQIDADPEIMRLRRRAGAYHATWLATARKLERLDERVGQ